MTPSWLHKHSTITGLHSLNPQYLEFLPSTVARQQILEVQLVAPNVLTSTQCISVTLTIAMDTALADGGDHDPSFGISNGNSFVGFQISDKANYPDVSPCFYHEGDNANGVLTNGKSGIGPLVTSRSYSSEVKLHIRPTEQWGPYHTEHTRDIPTLEIINTNLTSQMASILIYTMQMCLKHTTSSTLWSMSMLINNTTMHVAS